MFLPLIGWMSGVKGDTTAANADVDFCWKMASSTASREANRSSSVLMSKKRTGMSLARWFKHVDRNVIVFLSFASMLHCALGDGKTLVLLDNLNIKDTHSIFFRSLAGQ